MWKWKYIDHSHTLLHLDIGVTTGHDVDCDDDNDNNIDSNTLRHDSGSGAPGQNTAANAPTACVDTAEHTRLVHRRAFQ